MQVVILCGGKGTRMYPLTQTIPKSLIPINGKPFIHYQLELLRNNNITDVILCTGIMGEKIVDYVNQNNNFGIRILISHEPDPIGTGGALYNAYNYLEDSFFVMYGDSYLTTDLKAIQREFVSNVLLTVYKNTNKLYKNNVKIINNGKVKFNDPDSEFIDYGFIGMEKRLVTPVSELKSMFKNTVVRHVTVTEPFYEIGSFEGLNKFKEYVTEYL